MQHVALSVGREVFGSGMSFGFCTLARRQGEGRKSGIAEQLSELRNKKQKACTKNLMQALDLFGARSRNRTGTSLRTGDFKPLVVALNFLGLFAQQSSGIFGRKQPFSIGCYRPGTDGGHSAGKWVASPTLLSNLEDRRACRHPCRVSFWAMLRLPRPPLS